MTITAHAGAYETQDNTLESIRTILSHKDEIDVIEVDVTFRDDGTPVIIHAGNAGVDGGESLDEALGLIAKESDLMVNLDLKNFNPDFIPSVVELVNRHGLQKRAFWTGIDAEFMDVVTKCSPTIPRYLNCKLILRHQKDIEAIAAIIEKYDCEGANMHFASTSHRLAELLHDRGRKLSLWTCNNEAEVKIAMSYNPDNITSRFPAMVGKIVK